MKSVIIRNRRRTPQRIPFVTRVVVDSPLSKTPVPRFEALPVATTRQQNAGWGNRVQEIGKALPSVFKGHMQGANPPLVEVLAPLWPCVAGKSVAARSRPIAFDAGTLTLSAESPSWATQLGSMAKSGPRSTVSSALPWFGGCASRSRLTFARSRDSGRRFDLPASGGARFHRRQPSTKRRR
ncbi:MAG: hypothetical protein DMG24_17830 [Acidobacteria bacterium]|nr:MAG: hypothetical protein DMG24_17830 [Acidobacteriota bacterium]